jgi:hypothetical protein
MATISRDFLPHGKKRSNLVGNLRNPRRRMGVKEHFPTNVGSILTARIYMGIQKNQEIMAGRLDF